MKKLLAIGFLIFLAGCGQSATKSPVDEATSPEPTPEIAVDENGNLIGETEKKPADATDELAACREKNAQMSLDLESAQTKLKNCEADLAGLKVQKTPEKADISGIPEKYLKYVKKGILSEPQKEFPFETCGRMSKFLRKGWFEDFATKLLAQKIHFSNGFLETTDFLGGCESRAGKMVFFLGAERGDDLKFFLIKYNLASKKVEPALFFDGTENAVVTKLGKRNGAAIDFIADDGRVVKYFYDANIVVAE